MTATERLVSPWLSHKALEAQRVVFSMDDVAVYGPTLFTYDFGTAIKDKVIADYKILVSAVSSADVARQVIQRQLVSLTDDSSNKILQADLLFRQLIFRLSRFQKLSLSTTLSLERRVFRLVQ
jgi:predicted helicase